VFEWICERTALQERRPFFLKDGHNTTWGLVAESQQACACRRTTRKTCRIIRRPNVFVHLRSEHPATKNNEKLYILLFINSFFPLPHLPFIASSSPFSSFGRSLAPQSTHPCIFVLFSAFGGALFLSCLLYSFFVSAVSPPFLSFFSPLGSWAMMRETMVT
jgi:hypothetical protein